MEFLLDVEEGKQELLDCETCTRPQPASCQLCPLHLGQQPQVPFWLQFYFKLHQRVTRYNVLPDPGGVLDQEERTMKILDDIQGVIDERREEKRSKRERELERLRRRNAHGSRL